MQKLYIIRKFVIAKSGKEAIEKEKKQEVDECILEEKSLNAVIEKINPKEKEKQVGFKTN